ncbi:hypothetical protein ACBJ59_51980 [Nonomuraea sp. MTCD27]|uniref:hypothetical protein n=1 Tax=Nonomuraea sp. MTCD27 TaxID=1676747 RepID=UPI0035C111E7
MPEIRWLLAVLLLTRHRSITADLHTTGPDPELYDEAALDAWRARALTSPRPYPMPAAAGIGQQRGMEGPIVQA